MLPHCLLQNPVGMFGDIPYISISFHPKIRQFMFRSGAPYQSSHSMENLTSPQIPLIQLPGRRLNRGALATLIRKLLFSLMASGTQAIPSGTHIKVYSHHTKDDEDDSPYGTWASNMRKNHSITSTRS